MTLLQRQTAIRVNESLYELQIHGSPTYPFQAYLNEFSEFHRHFADWHCHAEFEFTVVLKGKFAYGINDQHYELSEGEGVFVNSNALHMSKPRTEAKESVTFSLVFSPEFLAEDKNSLLYQKFVLPTINNTNFKGCLLTKDILWQKEVLTYLNVVYQICEENEEEAEFLVRNRMLSAWEVFLKNQKKFVEERKKQPISILYEERAKELLKYMQTHYSEPIEVEDMIRACNLSRTDCFRCFRSILGKSPVEYLNEYRIKQAMYMLETTNQTITEVGMACGFNYLSYFGKLFRQATGVTPKEYRKQRKQE